MNMEAYGIRTRTKCQGYATILLRSVAKSVRRDFEAMKSKAKSKEPIRVKVANAVVKIYPCEYEKNGKVNC